ncbi:MAG: M48 family metallopeptidase, partial [Actinomycetota bacterium]
EIRAVIAHEVGHLRGGHARRNLVLTLGGSILVLALWWGLVSLAEGRISRSGLTILRGPIFSIFLLPIVMNLILGKERRRHEEVADRFAVDVTGDPELVIRMLTRLHTLESSPQQLKRSDEAISTHPSLVNRIAAIRSYATEREGRSA